MKYLYELKNNFENKKAFDLYYALKEILKEKRMSFNEIIFEFSQGLSVISGAYTILLDEDWDTPSDYGTVEIYIGETSTILDIETYVLLVESVCENYLNYHPEDKERIDKYIDKINERYAEFFDK
ncbi:MULTISPECIES: hypothetical protein [Pasteurellaceae]|uniref:CDI immunity protein domain-containing protein n=3 Tax=Pasteurellaceae TaxID=712 RepID=A0A1H7TW32_9PAST|nr:MULTISPECIES: hypothetical protein [Pasteurella]MDP8051870.1 hypothetical protein [Pasteurella atlantica]MDP8078625.1 hypothetical protein [Pasteurella skyensis]MDP8084619.1 hypothetical protein [Pasteurella skyensis]MDP8101418.1 hypothetical protein [Pasteurella atlantica]MDP8105458.1 hypothetical protein [Pasteurella atlantica]